jgi:integrase
LEVPTTPHQEDDIMQGKRVRALDSRGRPVPGLYVRDGRFIAGFKTGGRWTMRTLAAETLTEARRERESLLAGLREGRVAAPASVTFGEVIAEYQAARSLSERTRKHEQHLAARHLAPLLPRKVQAVTATDVARLLRGMRDTYSPWTCVAVYRVLAGTFALALRRGILTRSPMDGLAPAERPKQRNARRVAVLDADALARLVAAGSSERWRAALALAAYAGLRLGEVRALTWGDVDLDAGTLTVRRSLLPDGTAKPPKTEAGTRTVPLLPALRRLLVAWKLRSPHTRPGSLVVCTATGGHVEERNLRRALDDAKAAAGLTVTAGERLSWHALRHSWASMLATDLELPATTLARLTGHADAGFTLRVYARDGRDENAVVKDVLACAQRAGVGR